VGAIAVQFINGSALKTILLVLSVAIPEAAMANSLCDDMQTMFRAAPDFISLRGEPSGSQFHGSLKSQGMEQCEIRNKSPLETPIEDSRWVYECLWEGAPPGAMDWLQGEVRTCFPDASYIASGRVTAKWSGGVFHKEGVSIGLDFNPATGQLWLVLIPDGVGIYD
jgi:hypothetical protein